MGVVVPRADRTVLTDRREVRTAHMVPMARAVARRDHTVLAADLGARTVPAEEVPAVRTALMAARAVE